MRAELMSQWFRVVVSLVILCCNDAVVWALQGFVGNEGVCTQDNTVTHRLPSRIWVSHRETYQTSCGFLNLKTCTKYKISGHWETQPDVSWTETRKDEVCCEGYTEIHDRCFPVCHSDCINGLCTAPNRCTCVGGFLKREGSEVCEPVCTEPCESNQYCSAPEKCTCKNGFEQDPTDPTRCNLKMTLCNDPCKNGYCPVPEVCICMEGYEKKDKLNTCEPICSRECINGVCSAPGVCSCTVHYKLSEEDRFRCDPICEEDCIQGLCSGPNECTCPDDYKKSETDENICIPKMCTKICTNGFCSEGNVCTCKKGYQKNKNDPDICDPVCSKTCQNGICISPEVCTCLTNYNISKEDKYVCTPVCKEGCLNGLCSFPNVCTCNEGFKNATVDGNICIPICSQECKYGKCSAPEVCSCFEGYEKDPLDTFACRPICSNPCLNASCSGPETCSCYTGYEKVPTDSFRCLPICHEPCVNAECSDPEVCSCFEGFTKDVDHPNICLPFCSKGCQNGTCSAPEVCSCLSGFKQNPNDPTVCHPICTEDCVNSFCSSPGICTCFEGYEPDENNNTLCHAICREQCKHGKCDAPDKCLCDMGYIEAQNDPFSCTPHCLKDCINGNCTAPNFCECFPDHLKDQDEYHVCHAVCADGCKNGYCITPDNCMCKDGFHFVDTPNMCEPICSSCVNGKCEGPEICKCYNGYENPPERNDICEPICEQKCVNSSCSAPDTCECFPGFKKDKDGIGSCRPFCPGCINGECTAPLVCECNSGYKMDNESSTCSAVCSEECVNGACTSPNNCSCLWGFENQNNNPNNCSPPVSTMYDLYKCFFRMNLLSRNESQQCFKTELKLRLDELDECIFVTSLVLKYFSNRDLLDHNQYRLEFDCSLNYFSEDEIDPTLELECLTDNVFKMKMSHSMDGIEENHYSKLGFDRIMEAEESGIHESSKQKQSFKNIIPKIEPSHKSVSNKELSTTSSNKYTLDKNPSTPKSENHQSVSQIKSSNTEKQSSQKEYSSIESNSDKSILQPEHTTNTQSDNLGLGKILSRTETTIDEQVLQKESSAIEKDKEGLSLLEENSETTKLDSYKTNLPKDASVKDKSPEMPKIFLAPLVPGPIPVSDETPSSALVSSSKVKETSEIKTSAPTSEEGRLIPTVKRTMEGFLKDLKDLRNEGNKRSNSKKDNSFKEYEDSKVGKETRGDLKKTKTTNLPAAEESQKSGQRPTQMNHNKINIRQIPNELKTLPLIIKIDNLPFIKKGKITDEYFKDLRQLGVQEDWCLCFHKEPLVLCLDGTTFKVNLCRCRDEAEAAEPFEEKSYWLIWLGVGVLWLAKTCIFIILVRWCLKKRRRRRLAAAKELERKQNMFSNNRLQLQVNSNSGPAEDENITSSKL